MTMCMSCAGLLRKRGEDTASVTMEATLAGQLNAAGEAQLAALARAAAEAWWRPGHPGWSIWPAESEQFLRGVCGAASAVQVSAAPGCLGAMGLLPMRCRACVPSCYLAHAAWGGCAAHAGACSSAACAAPTV